MEAKALPKHGAGTAERPTTKSFQSLVGSLLWIARCSRPDIAFAVHRATSDYDMKLARRILRYLAGTTGMKLHMGGVSSTSDVQLTSFTDADYAADKKTQNSISGAVPLVGTMPNGWQVKQ